MTFTKMSFGLYGTVYIGLTLLTTLVKLLPMNLVTIVTLATTQKPLCGGRPVAVVCHEVLRALRRVAVPRKAPPALRLAVALRRVVVLPRRTVRALFQALCRQAPPA